MTFRNLLVPIDGSESDARSLEAALAIAKLGRSRIVACYAAPDPDELATACVGDGIGIYLSTDMMKSLEQRVGRQQAAARAHFDSWKDKAAETGAEVEMVVETGGASDLLREQGLFTDLIVTPLPSAGKLGDTMLLEAGLFDTCRPVLAVPAEGVTTFDPKAPILIAWNGRAEAARALTTALPVLRHAEGDIILLTIGRSSKPIGTEPAIAYLKQHGVKARGIAIHDRPEATGAILLGEAKQLGAGLLIMGAYTHSRLREMVLGGVTNHVIHSARLPVIFVH